MYNAVLCKIKTQEIPGADNIKLGFCLGYQVIVSKDTEDNQLGVFFEQDGCLTDIFASTNSLYRHSDKNSNKDKSGYFEDNARIKALKLKLGKSDGFWCPLSFFDFTKYDFSKEKEGWEFHTLNGIEICKKYYSPATMAQMRKDNQKRNRNFLWKAVGYCKGRFLNPTGEKVNFPEHYDTSHFKRSFRAINPGAKIVIQSKMHGTSGRIASVPTKRELYKTKFSSWFMNLIGKPTKFEGFSTKYGSRRVVLKGTESGYYGSNQFRQECFDSSKLKEGEAVYGEIVGYLGNGKPIMENHSTEKLKDKTLTKLFGKVVTYDYGCNLNENKFFIYNIKNINSEGVWSDIPYDDMIQRSQELGYPVCHTYEVIDSFDGDYDTLFKKVASYVEDEITTLPLKDPLGNHIQEGVIVREEFNGHVTFHKFKSTAFGIMEGYLKEDDSFVDMEESS